MHGQAFKPSTLIDKMIYTSTYIYEKNPGLKHYSFPLNKRYNFTYREKSAVLPALP